MISQHDYFDYDDYMLECIKSDIISDIKALKMVPSHREWAKSLRSDYEALK
jgi:hypothetical protein|tara:strand:- start:493 stop:645 length:153 start_codon:yes stop_codon:yes gene_type:complete